MNYTLAAAVTYIVGRVSYFEVDVK